MGDLAGRIELTKLARDLGAEERDLDFLADRPPEQLRELRRRVADALFTRHEDRVRRVAAVAAMLPAGLSARIARHAMGPRLSARVAAVMEPAEAAKLAAGFEPAFLSEVAAALDPRRVAGIVRLLDEDLVVEVGHRLLATRDHVALGRLVGVVRPTVAVRVLGDAAGEDLLRVVLFTDDRDCLAPIARALGDERLADVLRAAEEAGTHDEVAGILLAALDADTRARVERLGGPPPA